MNHLSIGFGCLLILFNLFIWHHSYAMASKRCGHQTMSGHEIVADWFDRENDLLSEMIGRTDKLDENNLDSNSSQKMVDDSNKERLSKLKKRPSVDCPANKKEQTGNFLRRRLVKKILPDEKRSSQESLELTSSSFSDRNSEK